MSRKEQSLPVKAVRKAVKKGKRQRANARARTYIPDDDEHISAGYRKSDEVVQSQMLL